VKRVLLDANVVLDVALMRPAHLDASAAVWARVEQGRVVGLLSAHSLTTIYYMVAKDRGRARAQQLVGNLFRIFKTAAVDENVISRALSLGFPDFEDAVTAAAAEAARCELIVTRDPRGFLASPVKAVSPELALASFDSEVHEPIAPYDAAPVRRRRRRSRLDERSATASRR
jgi:predicted nucleic acid-binding protein